METDTSVPAPPEAVLIRRARLAAHLTVEAAAAAVRAGGGKISASYWGDFERGAGGRRGKRVKVTASAQILADMAILLRVSPKALRQAGREDAADVLEEMARATGSGAPAPDGNLATRPSPDAEGLTPAERNLWSELHRLTLRLHRNPTAAEFFPASDDPEEEGLRVVWRGIWSDDSGDLKEELARVHMIARVMEAVDTATGRAVGQESGETALGRN